MGAINIRSGRIQLDFRYRGTRCREQTKLADTERNRKRMEKLLDRIDAEILLGTFEYGKYFPNSRRASQFDELDRRRQNRLSGTPILTTSQMPGLMKTKSVGVSRISQRRAALLEST